jgi:hypothetical protein
MEDETDNQRVKAVVMDLHGVVYTHFPDGDAVRSADWEMKIWEERFPEEYNAFIEGNAAPLIEKEKELYSLESLARINPSDKVFPVYPVFQANEFIYHSLSKDRKIVTFSTSGVHVSEMILSMVSPSVVDNPSVLYRSAADFGVNKKDPETWRKMFATLPQGTSIEVVMEDSEKNLMAGVEAARSLGHEVMGYMPATCPLSFTASKQYFMGDYREFAKFIR